MAVVAKSQNNDITDEQFRQDLIKTSTDCGIPEYDFEYGERFYDLTWNHGLKHEDILSAIDVPCIYIHAKESIHENGTYLCAASREQAERAVSYIGDNCRLIETDSSDHVIHTVHSDVYIEAVNSLLK